MKNIISPIEATTTEEKEHNFVRAELFELYDSDNRNLKFHQGIRNADKPDSVFAVVSRKYTLIQHEDIYNQIYEFVSGLGYDFKKSVLSDGDGGQMFLTFTFPNVSFNVGNEKITLRMPIVNSYDTSRALNGRVTAFTINNEGKEKTLYSSEGWAYFNKKHMGNLDVNNFCLEMEKGIKAFQEKMKAKLEEYHNTQINPQKALLFLQACQKENPDGVPKKIFKEMETILEKGGETVKSVNDLNNQYTLYRLGLEAAENQSKPGKNTADNCLKVDKFVRNQIDHFKGFGVDEDS